MDIKITNIREKDSAENKQGFYKKFGFIERPSEFFGPGMHQWIEY